MYGDIHNRRHSRSPELEKDREMDKAKMMLMLVWFVIMATTIAIALDTETSASTTYSVKKPFYSGYEHALYNGHLILGGRSSVQLKVQAESELTLPMYAVHDRRDVEALLSFRDEVISDPHGSLLNWTAQNSQNVCSWNGIRCRKRTNRVVAITLPGLALEGSLSPSLGSLSLLHTESF